MAPHLGDRVVRLGGHHKQATFAAFTADDRLVVSLGDDESALSWDVKTGKLVSAHAYQAGEQVAFSRDGALIAESMYFGTDSSATIWDAVSATKRVSLPGDGKNVWAIAFSPDGSRVALTNNAHQLRVFDSSSGALLATLEGVNEFKTPSFSPDGSHIAAIANDDEDIFVFAIDASVSRLSIDTGGIPDEVMYSPDGSTIATTAVVGDDTVRLWDAGSGDARAVLAGAKGAIHSLVFSADGSRMLTASDDSSARLFDTTSGKSISTLNDEAAGSMSFAALSPDGTRVATVSLGGRAKIWDVAAQTVVATLNANGPEASTVAFNHSGDRVVTADTDGSVTVWAAT